ncbi:MAG: TonB-dependent receptor [Candidatus Aminicenantes bacterium]|nr:TonB-dependent receptor [Candidatus Aminicenantes bacterium]
MSKFRVFISIPLALILICALAIAQAPTGKVMGRVTDEDGEPLPGTTVEATSPKLLGTTTAITDETGTYRLFALPSGTYTITYSLPGFDTLIRKDVYLQIEQTITLNIALRPSTLEESITVIGESPIIDVKSTVKGKTITRELFMSLPRGRDFTGLISIIPGTHYESNTGGLSVDGATGTENMWYVDGTDTTDMHIGTQDQNVVFELIDEVQVKSSGYPAEYGGSMGGVINVITRSGGNAFHGDLLGFYDDHSTLMYGKSRDYLRIDPFDDNRAELVNDDDLYWGGGKDRDPTYRLEGIFQLGGYILKDRLWFFGSFNPIYRQQKAPRFFLDAADPDAIEDFYYKRWNWNGQIKLTAQPFAGLRVTASVVNSFYKYRGSIPSINGTSTYDYEWGKYGFDYPKLSGNITMDYTVGNSMLVSLRGGYFRRNTTNQQIVGPETFYRFQRSNEVYTAEYAAQGLSSDLIHYRGWRNWPGSDYEVGKSIEERIVANLDLTYYAYFAGEHAFKMGVQYIRLHENEDYTLPHPRLYIYWGDDQRYTGLASGEVVQGTYGWYQVRGSFSSPYGWFWDIHSDNWAIYLQDSWTIGDKLTIQAGIRTESEYIPSFADPVTSPELAAVQPIQFGFGEKLAPRLGAIYDVFGDSSLKVFGNFAIYYDVMKLYMAEGAYGGFKWLSDYYELNDLDWTKIAASGEIDDQASQSGNGANTYVGTMNWRIPSFDTTNPDMKPVAQREITFGFEKKLLEELSLSVRVVQKHLIRTIEDIGVLTPQGEKYYNDNPGYGWSLPISEGGKFSDDVWPTPKAKREYWGVNIALDKRFSNNWQGGINYTWSRAAGNYSGLSSSDEGGRNSPNVERNYDLWFMPYAWNGDPLDGCLQHDRTHYFKLYGSYAFPFGLTVGVVGYGRSGLPLTTRLYMNNVYVYPNNRADIGRLPFTFWSDLYMEYNLRIAGKYQMQVNLNIYNVTNTSTWQAQDTSQNRIALSLTDEQIMSTTYDWKAALATGTYDDDPRFGQFTSKLGRWSARLGVRFSF